MNKQEFISAVASKVNMSNVETAKVVNAVLDVIQEEIRAGNKIILPGFGQFEARVRGARTGINPATGEILFTNFETKNKAKEVAKELYTKKDYKGDVFCKYIKDVVEGEVGAFEVKYTPSKSAKQGTYICFGVEA